MAIRLDSTSKHDYCIIIKTNIVKQNFKRTCYTVFDSFRRPILFSTCLGQVNYKHVQRHSIGGQTYSWQVKDNLHLDASNAYEKLTFLPYNCLLALYTFLHFYLSVSEKSIVYRIKETYFIYFS